MGCYFKADWEWESAVYLVTPTYWGIRKSGFPNNGISFLGYGAFGHIENIPVFFRAGYNHRIMESIWRRHSIDPGAELSVGSGWNDYGNYDTILYLLLIFLLIGNGKWIMVRWILQSNWRVVSADMY